VVDLDRRLAEVAARQHSLISLADVRAAGGTRSHASTRVRSGRWELVSDGVYRIAGVPWTDEAKVMALVLSVGPGAAASHACAARLLGLGFATAPPEVTVPRDRKRQRDSGLVHRSTDLDRCAIRVVEGIPVTDPARTLLDLGRYIGPGALRRAVEQARRLELVTWTDLIRCLAVHARQGRHGVRRMRMVIAAGAASDEVTDTDSELMALTLIRERGLPEPTLHHRIYEGDILVAELDLAYVPLLVAFEIDGGVHLDPTVRKKDDGRDHELRRRGWIVRRIWWEIPVRQPELFLRIVRDTLRDAQRAREGSLVIS
jgi:predicted transcriptional regulator of viral defense system/very-short-patch-repair endonuclease